MAELVANAVAKVKVQPKVSTDIFKELEYTFFKNKVVSIGNYKENVSEDASFCLDIAQKTGVKPKIIPSLKINHLKEIFI